MHQRIVSSMKRNAIILSLLFVFFCSLQNTFAQVLPADTLWSAVLGGSANECDGTAMLSNFGMNAAYVTVDDQGDFYVATSSASSDGMLNGNSGLEDIWVVKLTSGGDTIWTRRFGGSGNERAYRIRSVKSGGVVVVGSTLSTDGSFADSKGGYDAFLLRIDASGQLIYKKCYGGSDNDHLYDIVENQAGNFVACGESSSINGDLVGVGSGLAWVLFINGTTGAVTNSKTFTGPDHSAADFLENFAGITCLSDGSGYLVSGFTTPEFFNPAKDNIWVQKINNSGQPVWTKKYGSVNGGDYCSVILDAGGGSFYMVGTTSASGGDNSSGYYGGPTDGWLIKCDASGNIIWNKHYGGSDWDVFYDAVVQPSGNILISGFTRSTNNDLSGTAPLGLTDYWLLQLTETGNVVDMRRSGGSKSDMGIGLAYDSIRNRILMVGRSESSDGYVQRNLGGKDLWAVCFGDEFTTGLQTVSETSDMIIYPNPTRGELYIISTITVEQITICDVLGKEVIKVFPPVVSRETNQINLAELSSGLYYVRMTKKGVSATYPVIKTD